MTKAKSACLRSQENLCRDLLVSGLVSCFADAVKWTMYCFLQAFHSPRASSDSNKHPVPLRNVCVGTLGWWVLGYAFAYGGGINRFIGTTNFLGEGFYTKDASGNILAPGCANNACQSTALAWFFQWLDINLGLCLISSTVSTLWGLLKSTRTI